MAIRDAEAARAAHLVARQRREVVDKALARRAAAERLDRERRTEAELTTALGRRDADVRETPRPRPVKGNPVSESPTMNLAANVIRMLAVDAVQKANSGHPGMPMGMADVGATCCGREFLRYDPQDPHWPNRDRFVLSAGHGVDAALRAAAPHRLRRCRWTS